MHVLMVPSWLYTETRPVLGSFFMEQAEAVSKNVSKMTIAFVEMSYLSVDRSKILVEFTDKWMSKKEHDGFDEYRAFSNSYIPRSYMCFNYIIYLNLKRLVKRIISEKGNIDIIHLQSVTTHGYAVKRISEEYKIPYVLTEHSTLFSRGKIENNYKKIVEPVIKNATKIACVGPGLKFELSKYSSLNIDVIPNMVNNDFFITLEELKKKDGFHFVSIAFLTEKKGIDILLKAFALHLEKHSKSKLSIGGDGPCRKDLERLAKDLGIERSVEFLGELGRKDVLNLVALSHCFVLPSRHETFGVVFIEANAAGLPVIATKCDGPMSIINDSNGILVDIDDENKLSDAMNTIYYDYLSYDLKKIQKDCYFNYSSRNIAKRIVKMYEEVVSK